MPSIKAVTFDFWETLFSFVSKETLNHVKEERTKRFSELLGVEPDVINRTYEKVVLTLNSVREKTGFEFTVDELLEIFLKELKLNSSKYLNRCHEIFVEAIYKHFPGPNLGVVNCLEYLKGIGMKLAIISNTIHGEVEKTLLKEFDLLKYFDAIALSCELKVRKPRREIFFWVMNRLGITRGEGIHIGDDPVADIKGALKSGLWAAHYIEKKEHKSKLAHLALKNFLELPEKLKELEWKANS